MTATNSRKPKAFQVQDSPERLEIRWTNRELYGAWRVIIAYLILAGYAPFLLLFFWQGFVFSGLLASAVALYVLIAALKVHFTRTVITLDARRLRIEEGPFPWPRVQSLNRKDISEFVLQLQYAVIGSERRGTCLFARLKDGTSVRLTEPLPRGAARTYLHSALAERLSSGG